LGGGTRQLQFVDDNLEAVSLLLEILQEFRDGILLGITKVHGVPQINVKSTMKHSKSNDF